MLSETGGGGGGGAGEGAQGGGTGAEDGGELERGARLGREISCVCARSRSSVWAGCAGAAD